MFGAASEAFSQKNINWSRLTSRLSGYFAPGYGAAAAKAANIRVRGYVVLCARLPLPRGSARCTDVVRVALKPYTTMGWTHEISLGDTIGVGTPLQAQRMLTAVWQTLCPIDKLALHFSQHLWSGAGEFSYVFGPLGGERHRQRRGRPRWLPLTQKVPVATSPQKNVLYMLNGHGHRHGCRFRTSD